MTRTLEVQQFPLWDRMDAGRRLVSFDLEVTARCNNDCRHCYISMPAGDKPTKEKELSLLEIGAIADEAVSLGAVWCLMTGGEPLLREDFPDIYLMLKRKGLLVSVFTNATLLSQSHIDLFRKYPPRDIEVSIYGVTPGTYERVTRTPGSFFAFWRGMHLIFENNMAVRLKAMALRSNVHELGEIFRFCQEHTKDYFRFDPFLHLRFDGDPEGNKQIVGERLTPQEIVALERSDPDRSRALLESCDRLIMPELQHSTCSHLFHCRAGKGSCAVSSEGIFRLCSSLWHHDCVYDLRKGTLTEAYRDLVPRVREMRSNNRQFLDRCRSCAITNLCPWCPAHAYLDSGQPDEPVEYFCAVAHARAEALPRPPFRSASP